MAEYHRAMARIQIRDVSETTVRALKTRAAERGRTLTAYLRRVEKRAE